MQGVLSTHEEFGYLNGSNGTRVRPAFGFQGLDPTVDCPDASVW